MPNHRSASKALWARRVQPAVPCSRARWPPDTWGPAPLAQEAGVLRRRRWPLTCTRRSTRADRALWRACRCRGARLLLSRRMNLHHSRHPSSNSIAARPRRPALFVLLVCLSSLAGATANAQSLQDYPQWRGPQRDGAAAGFVAPSVWPATLTRRWKVEVGEGYATPLVIGDS